MSVLGKIWQIKNKTQGASLLSKLLANRGFKNDTEIERFFHPSAERDFHDPFLMKDMERAVARIGEAIEKSERIMIFGDYDADGITGAAILMRTLTKLGANVSYRLPHRIEDGYGLREKSIREFAKLNVKLAITVDNGISCFSEVALANSLGIDVIITDHHALPEKIPSAYAILHPKMPDSGYPFADLTGAGVALKLAQALFMKRMKNPEDEIRKLLDLACMGTIADLGLLHGENRYIVKEGLKVLENTRWPGLSRLKESAGVRGKIDTYAIGFLLGPRLNAAGRISHPSHALKLLLHDEKHSAVLAQTLEKLNRRRQKMMEELMETADALASGQAQEPVIIISHKDFHGGIIGLLAAKLSEKYCRPAIVMEERGDVFVGSCRTIPGVDIVEALGSTKELFTHFGGHSAAAGFDLPGKNLDVFKKNLKAHIRGILKKGAVEPALDVECELPHADISMKTVEILRWFEPFGAGNRVPQFLCKNVAVRDYNTVGADKKHLKITGEVNSGRVDCIGFRLGQFIKHLDGAKALDMVCEIEEDDWNGGNRLQLKVADFKIRK